MGKRICLTEQQKKDEAARQMRGVLADALAIYKNRKELTNQQLAKELGIGYVSVGKILRGEDVCLPLSVTHTLLCMAGHKITKEGKSC